MELRHRRNTAALMRVGIHHVSTNAGRGDEAVTTACYRYRFKIKTPYDCVSMKNKCFLSLIFIWNCKKKKKCLKICAMDVSQRN